MSKYLDDKEISMGSNLRYSKLQFFIFCLAFQMSKYGYAYRSSEEISQIGILLFFGCLLLLGLGLLGLLLLLGLFFLLIVLLVSDLGGNRSGASSESALTLRNELVDSLALESVDDLVNFGISGIGLNATEEGFNILGG